MREKEGRIETKLGIQKEEEAESARMIERKRERERRERRCKEEAGRWSVSGSEVARARHHGAGCGVACARTWALASTNSTPCNQPAQDS